MFPRSLSERSAQGGGPPTKRTAAPGQGSGGWCSGWIPRGDLGDGDLMGGPAFYHFVARPPGAGPRGPSRSADPPRTKFRGEGPGRYDPGDLPAGDVVGARDTSALRSDAQGMHERRLFRTSSQRVRVVCGPDYGLARRFRRCSVLRRATRGTTEELEQFSPEELWRASEQLAGMELPRSPHRLGSEIAGPRPKGEESGVRRGRRRVRFRGGWVERFRAPASRTSRGRSAPLRPEPERKASRLERGPRVGPRPRPRRRGR